MARCGIGQLWAHSNAGAGALVGSSRDDAGRAGAAVGWYWRERGLARCGVRQFGARCDAGARALARSAHDSPGCDGCGCDAGGRDERFPAVTRQNRQVGRLVVWADGWTRA